MKNAFNECSRASFLARVSERFPDISAWTHWCYAQPAELRFGDRRILASAGVQQGDPLGPLLFSLVLLDFIQSAGFRSSVYLSLWYLDDGTFIGRRSSLTNLLTSFSQDGPAFGLHLNLAKCEIFWPSGDSTFPEFPVAVRRVGIISGGVELLGCPLWGSLNFYSDCFDRSLLRLSQAHALLGDLEDPQVELHLLRSCLGVCKVTHLLRCVPPDVVQSFLPRFDALLRSSLDRICRCGLSDNAWCQATLPFRLGGLGLRDSVSTIVAAYLGCCNDVRSLSCSLLDLSSVVFPGESSLRSSLSCGSDYSSTQHAFQVPHDNERYQSLVSNSSIRDRARLLAASDSTGCSSAWLKAIPNPSLGLAMPVTEFVVAVRIWLGIPLFPTAQLCSCSSLIDSYGDHLLGCSYGPLRIRRHDALTRILFHSMLLDNSGVLREQRVSGDNQSRPGDLYHPDFYQGCPAFFDVSVRNTLSPSYISQASVSAGAAAAAGEALKDKQHEANVVAAGGQFYPLIVETFGVWTPFAQETLKDIARRTTARNGLSPKKAFKNLIQQLSVCLWKYNAKTVLRYWALHPVVEEAL